MKEIRSSEEWDEIVKQSEQSPQLMLKHSSACPISGAGFRAFQEADTDVPKHYLVVQNSRSLSNELEQDLDIQHETPQLFLLKEGKVFWHASHYGISAVKIERAITEANK